jgi:hypothetical protein
MPDGFRQEVINVALARLLQGRGLVTAPEYIFDATLERGRKMVDVLVYYRGLRTAIEGEVADQPQATARALESARRRVEEGIAHIGVAVVYPESLRHVKFGELTERLSACVLQIALVSEAGETGYASGDVGYLATALAGTFERLIREDVVGAAVRILDESVSWFASALALRPGVIGRLMNCLGIRGVGERRTPEGRPQAPAPGEETPERAACRIGGLVIVNAMIFQEVLSGSDDRVRSLSTMPTDRDPVKAFIEHWSFILGEIDYYPIFHIARAALRSTTAHREITTAVGQLADTARELVNMRAPMRHDLMGRVYHRLLSQAKYLGTYYTSIPAATLLLEMALRPDAWPVAWHELDEMGRFHIVDLACGTGTLLMAAAQTVAENYIERSQGRGPGLDLARLHQVVAEEVVYGYDVLASAVHLTASTLALRAPQVTFDRMNLYSLPLGGKGRRLGSIEFLHNKTVNMHLDLFAGAGGSERVDPHAESPPVPAPLPDMDLCVMNPPFTRSVGGNLLFGSSPPEERRDMQKKLGAMLRDPKVLANSTAGLGSVFMAVAHGHLKAGGRMAVVLPKAMLSGVAWAPTRELLRSYYHVEHLVCSHDPQRWNFSESTHLSEVLLVAAKGNRTRKSADADARATAVNLWRNPTTPFEALAIARTLRQREAPDLETGQGALELMLGEEKLGEAVSVPWSYLKEREGWLLPCSFAQADLVRAAHYLLQGKLWLPGRGVQGKLPMAPLGEMATVGPDRRDVHDGFSLSQSATSYPAFWGHDADNVTTMRQHPNAHLSALGHPKPGRPLRKVEALWPMAAQVLFAERLRLSTQRALAVRITEASLSNVWWPLGVTRGPRPASRQKALVLWFNSTVGLLSALSGRLETEGAWVCFKKPVLAHMPTLDVAGLSSAVLRSLARSYDELADRELGTFSEMGEDPVRAALDAALCKALRLPDLSMLRTIVAQEPILSLRRL